jgi:WD40 repeat protein
MTPGSVLGTAPLAIDEENPWPGLSAFDESAERFFNGRREESAALRRLVMQAPLTVLFGASGLGKTSLIQAGLFPLLRRDVLPVYVRLDPRDRDAALIEQVKAALAAEISKRGVDAPECPVGQSLWEYLHRTGLEFWNRQNQLLTPLFVFDQFEEVFTLGAANADAVSRLRVDLADLIENRIPNNMDPGATGLSLDNQRYKVLLSFREDFLPRFERWKHDIPSIMRNRLQLLPMSSEQAFDALNKTAPHLAPEPIARRIVSFVAAAGDADEGTDLEIAPALLSLVCHGLNERRKEQRKAQFDEALLTSTGQAIVADFYRNAVSGFPARVRRFIERDLITERGFRKPCDVDDARTIYGITDKELASLVDRRLLRIEPARGTERVELTHDLLTRVVREDRDRRRLRERRKHRLIATGGAFAAVALLTVWFGYQAREERLRTKAAQEQQIREVGLRKTAEDASATAEAERANAVRSAAEAQQDARAALAHQLAGAAITAVKDNDANTAIPFALRSIAITRDADGSVLKDAEDALRRAAASLGRELELPGHTANITQLEFSPDGRRIATSGADAVRVWDLAQSEQVAKFPACSLLEFSIDWKKLACGSSPLGDFLDFETREVIRHIGFRGYDLTEMGFSPDGKLMFWGTTEETIVSDGAGFEKKFGGHSAVFSADGKILATILGHAGKLWDVGSGGELRTWEGEFNRAVFSPDGKRLAFSTFYPNSSASIFDLASGNVVRFSVPLPGNASISCIAFTPDSSRLAVLGRSLRIVDATSGKELNSPVPASFEETCRFARGRNTLVGSGPAVGEMWDLTSNPPARITVDALSLPAVNREGTRIADAIGPAARVWNFAKFNPNSPEVLIYLPSRAALPLPAAAFSPDARQVITSDSLGRARVWDTASERRLLTLVGHSQPVYSIAYSPDGNRIVTGGSNGEVKLWDARSGQFLRDLKGHRDRILATAFSFDSKRVATSGNDHQVIVWDVATGTDLTKAAPIRPQTNAFGVAFSGDGKQFVLVGDRATVLDAVSLRETISIPGNIPLATSGVTVSRDGQAMAAVDINGVRLWRAGSQWKALPDTAGGVRGLQLPVAFSRNGRRLVTPGVDSTLRIWDTASASLISILYYGGPESGADKVSIKAVAFSDDEKQVYAVGDNSILFHFSVSLDDLIAEARKRSDANKDLTAEDCEKYLHQPCPDALRRVP